MLAPFFTGLSVKLHFRGRIKCIAPRTLGLQATFRPYSYDWFKSFNRRHTVFLPILRVLRDGHRAGSSTSVTKSTICLLLLLPFPSQLSVICRCLEILAYLTPPL